METHDFVMLGFAMELYRDTEPCKETALVKDAQEQHSAVRHWKCGSLYGEAWQGISGALHGTAQELRCCAQRGNGNVLKSIEWEKPSAVAQRHCTIPRSKAV